MRLALLPLLVVVFLLLASGIGGVGTSPETAEIMMTGEHTITDHRGALIVGDATVTIPPNTTVAGPIYVIGGEFRINGTVSGNVTQLSGTLVVPDRGTINGSLQHIAGTERIASDATIAARRPLPTSGQPAGPLQRLVPGIVVTVSLAIIGGVLGRWQPSLLRTVSTAGRHHPLVSTTVGGLLSVTMLSVIVFMLFTILLIPVALLVAVVGVAVLAYGLIAGGYWIGTQADSTRPGMMTSIGTAALVGGLQLLGSIPILGDLLVLVIFGLVLGAVIITYFGLKPFVPPTHREL